MDKMVVTNVKVIPSKKFKITVDALSHQTFKVTLKGNEIKDGKVVESKRKGVISEFRIFNLTSKDITLSEFDHAVLDASIAEQLEGNEYTTPEIIYRHLGGGYNLSKDMKAVIMESLENLANIRIHINMDDAQKKLGYGKDREKSFFTGYLLPTETLEVKVNGQTTTAIHFLRRGIIFSVSDMKNQILTCDKKLLEAPIRHTERGIALNHYLLRRISEIIGSQTSNSQTTPLKNIITFEDMFQSCNLENLNRKQQANVKNLVTSILEFFVEQNLISGFKFDTRERNKVHGIIIEFKKN